jgi:TonB family protein
MTSRRKKWAARTGVAVAIALASHVAIIALFILFGVLAPIGKLSNAASAPLAHNASTVDDDRPMEIETIVNQLERPDEKTAAEKAQEEAQKKEEEDKNPHGQVVDIARPAIEERPDKANYVSEYDSKVDRETKGPNGRDKAGALKAFEPPPGSPDVREPSPAIPGSEAQAPSAKPGRPGPLAMRELERRRAREAEGPAPTEGGDAERAGSQRHNANEPKPVEQPGEAGEGGQPSKSAQPGRAAQQPGLPGDRKPNLLATPDMLNRAIGRGAGSMDYLKDVDDGELTALNSKKWKHAPFFNRVKHQVANEWHPEVVYVRHDPSGNVYGIKDRVTVLRVHLNPDGKLAAWTVLQSSGVEFLDSEAIDAFRRAQPFPNPPKDLVDGDGQIHFNFAFIFELSGHGSLKVYKYQ